MNDDKQTIQIINKIPTHLQNDKFRFVLLLKEAKDAFETGWQTTKNYKFNDEKLLKHIAGGGNYGIIAGHGGLRIIDADNGDFAKELRKKLPPTFEVASGSGEGKTHFYLICHYDKFDKDVIENGRNRGKYEVFPLNYNTGQVNKYTGKAKDSDGEFRKFNSYVVAPGSIHPDTKNEYRVSSSVPIYEINGEQLDNLIKPYFDRLPSIKTTITSNLTLKDESRSAREFKEVLRLIKNGKSKEQIFTEMKAFAKWEDSPIQYKELTYNKAFNLLLSEKEQQKFKEEERKLETISKIKSLKQIFSDGIPIIEWRVKNLLPQKGITFFGGASGSYKTWFAMYTALCINEGKPVLGKFPTKKAPVLYIDEENGNITLPARFDMLRNGNKFDEDFSNVFVSIFEGFKLDNKVSIAIMADIIKQYGIKTVVIDSMVRCMEGEEDKSTDVRMIFDNLKELLNNNDELSFIFLHHTAKQYGKKMSLNSLRGSGDFAAFADVVAMFNPTNNGFVDIELVKNRHIDMSKFSKFCVKFGTENEGVSLNYFDISPETKNAVELCIEDIEKWTEETGFNSFKSSVVKAKMKELGHKSNAIYDALGEMMNRRMLFKLTRGVYEVASANSSL